MAQKPNDRLKKNGKSDGKPKIINSVDIKIPDKEVYIMQPDEKAPSGNGTCSCHSVCTCVPVKNCNCDMVCTCDAVCSTNNCSCHPFEGCPSHVCSCNPVCSCVPTCGCTSTHYWFPN